MLTFLADGKVIAGFVGRWDGAHLASRPDGDLILHAVTLTADGTFVSHREFQTTDWYNDGLYSAPGGSLLVRAQDSLRLYSSSGAIENNRQIEDNPGSGPVIIFPLPHGRAFVIESWSRGSRRLEVIDSNTLRRTDECVYPGEAWTESFSDHNVLVLAEDPKDYSHREIRVFRICGPLQYGYDWHDDKDKLPSGGVLVDDDHFVTAWGAPMIEFFDRGVKRWTETGSFDRKHDGIDSEVPVSEDGSVFAVLVKTIVGGSRFFDIDGHLKSAKIVVYHTTDGRRLSETPVQPGSYDFEFALSPKGDTLAVLRDGDLMLVPIGK